MPNILIVEDEKTMQDIIADYMGKGGHTCFTADDGIDALVTLKDHPMDLMILRSEEHTSELESRLAMSYAVSCLKKKI